MWNQQQKVNKLNYSLTLFSCSRSNIIMRNTYPVSDLHDVNRQNSYYGIQNSEKQTSHIDTYDLIQQIQQFYNQYREKQQLQSKSYQSIVFSNTSIESNTSKTYHSNHFYSNQVLDCFIKSSHQHGNYHYTNTSQQSSNFNFASHKQILQEEETLIAQSLVNLQQWQHIKIMQLIGRILFKQESSSLKQITQIKQNYQTELNNLRKSYDSNKQLLNNYIQQSQFLKDQLTQQRSEKNEIQYKLNQSQQQIIATKQFVKHQEYSKEKLLDKLQKFQYIIEELQRKLDKTQAQLLKNQNINKVHNEEIKKLIRERKQYFNEAKNYQQANQLLSLQIKKFSRQIEELKISLNEKQNYVNYLENSNSNFKKSMYSQNQNENFQNSQTSAKKYIKVKKFDTVIQQKSEQLSEKDQKSLKSSERISQYALRAQREWNVEQIDCLKDLNFYQHSHFKIKKQGSQNHSFESLSSQENYEIFETNKKEYLQFNKNIGSDRRMSFGNGKEKICQLRNPNKGANSLQKIMQTNLKPNIFIRDMSQYQKNNKKSVRSYQKFQSQIVQNKQSKQEYTSFYQPKKLNFIYQKDRNEKEQKQPYAPATQNITSKRRINNVNFFDEELQNDKKISLQNKKTILQKFRILQQESSVQGQNSTNQKKEKTSQDIDRNKKHYQKKFQKTKDIKLLQYQIQILKNELLNKCQRLFQFQGQNQQILEELTDKINFQRIELHRLSQKCIILNSENEVQKHQNQELIQNLAQLQIQIKELGQLYSSSIQDNIKLKESMKQAESVSNLRVQKVKEFCKKHLITVTQQFEQSLRILKEQLIQYESLSKKIKEGQSKIMIKTLPLLQNFSQTQAQRLALQLQVFQFKVQSQNIKNIIFSNQIKKSQKQGQQETYKFQTTCNKINQNQNLHIFEQSSFQLNGPRSFNQNKSDFQFQQSQNKVKERPIQRHSLRPYNQQIQMLNSETFSFLSKRQKINLSQYLLDYHSAKKEKYLRTKFKAYQNQSQIKHFKYQICQNLYILAVKQQSNSTEKNNGNKEDDQLFYSHFFITKNKIINLANNKILKSKQSIVVKDFNMLILGNCQLLVQKDCLLVTRHKKKCHFKGNIEDGNWKINKIYEGKLQ